MKRVLNHVFTKDLPKNDSVFESPIKCWLDVGFFCLFDFIILDRSGQLQGFIFEFFSFSMWPCISRITLLESIEFCTHICYMKISAFLGNNEYMTLHLLRNPFD